MAMKKLGVLGVIIGLVLLVTTSLSWAAAGNSAQRMDKFFIGGVPVKKIVHITWMAGTGDDAGTVPSITIDTATYELAGYYLYSIETKPGTGDAQPADNYDIAVTDAQGLDVSWALAYNRDETNAEIVFLANATYGYYVVRGNLTIAVTNSVDASVTGDIWLTFIAQ